MDEIDLKSILGETKDGQWTPDALPAAAEGESREQEEGSEFVLKTATNVQGGLGCGLGGISSRDCPVGCRGWYPVAVDELLHSFCGTA